MSPEEARGYAPPWDRVKSCWCCGGDAFYERHVRLLVGGKTPEPVPLCYRHAVVSDFGHRFSSKPALPETP